MFPTVLRSLERYSARQHTHTEKECENNGAPMQRKTALPAIPDIAPGTDERISLVLAPLKEIIEAREGRRGSALETSPTFRDLVEMGLISEEAALDAVKRRSGSA